MFVERLLIQFDWSRYGLLLLGIAIAFVVAMFIVVGTIVAKAGVEAEQVTVKLNPHRFPPASTPAVPTAEPVLPLTGVEMTEFVPEVTEILPLPTPTALPLSSLPTPTTVFLDMEEDFTIATPLIGWPVGGQVTQNYGCSAYYTEIANSGCPDEMPWFHDGLDIANIEGAPVRAAMKGRVVYADADGDGPECGEYRGYGLGVIVDNGEGWTALYAHLARIDVVLGQDVEPNTLIGAVGQTGCTTGPHLHFGLRHQGELLDPSTYIPN